MTKVINDPVHGHIMFGAKVMRIVDTQEFQRLRDLKQLGLTQYVFPGATHTRFEHCLGVAHLAGKLAKRLMLDQPELNLTQHHCELVEIAGLVHDLGHGPFSHCFEGFINIARENVHFEHEEMSCALFEKLVKENNIDMSDEDIRQVQAYVIGERDDTSPYAFLSDIVSNKRNSVDVDKFDYLERDCYYCGIKMSFDCSRLMMFSRVIDNEICYPSKEIYSLYEMFHMRYTMHKQVYSHKVSQALEYMIVDIFILADSVLHISQSIDSPSEYCRFSDSLLSLIEMSQDPRLVEAQKLIKRIRQRDLYKLALEALISKEWNRPTPTEDDIVNASSGHLVKSDLILKERKINYALKDQNPVDNISFFYAKEENPKKFHIGKAHVSLMISDVFEEHYVRLMCHEHDVQIL
ncbi:MAG: putative Deoxynucleoside triphosphate triphosphohydrolase SAMHD1 [Streblomastix strix]|uniref:Putative Deoxynucleoside triphosphate triphosphohydrolase SAMHD1 n=1 Tax=Streblomastix strix TaxID=222440 RepID=A0A5J4WUD6_9EUKA|nr:MAG: putative Deoxynucleoside triphosphate triphosphohydrolase SAMHD1 [Streblomastix strix]